MPIDPDSPFAKFGEGSVDDRRTGLREIVIKFCKECMARWVTPSTDKNDACKRCGSLKIVKSEPYREGAPRV